MIEFKYVIQDKEGIHARPAGVLVKAATEFKSNIQINKDGKKGDLKRIFGVMGLGIKQGDEVVITIEGEDEAEAAEIIEELMKKNL